MLVVHRKYDAIRASIVVVIRRPETCAPQERASVSEVVTAAHGVCARMGIKYVIETTNSRASCLLAIDVCPRVHSFLCGEVPPPHQSIRTVPFYVVPRLLTRREMEVQLANTLFSLDVVDDIHCVAPANFMFDGPLGLYSLFTKAYDLVTPQSG